MVDYSKYNVSVAWRTIASNVYQLSRSTVDNPATFRVFVNVIDQNEIGAGEKESGYYFTDNFGFPFVIFNTSINYIDVEDSFRVNLSPTCGKVGIIHKSAYKGYSLALPSHLFRFLHPLAFQNNNKYSMSILWANDPNARDILFENTDEPKIETYNATFIDVNGVEFNPYEDYGDKVEAKLFEYDSEGNKIERTEKPYFYIVDGVVTGLTFGSLDSQKNWIIQLRN